MVKVQPTRTAGLFSNPPNGSWGDLRNHLHRRMVRGAEREFETSLGDYKEVAGVYLPHSVESGVKGSPNKAQITFEKIEANVTLDDNRFKQP